MMFTEFKMKISHTKANFNLGGELAMQNKSNLDTHNEVITVSEPWHRGSGFTWMLLALAGAVFFLSGAVAKAQTTYSWRSEAPTGNWHYWNSWWNGSGEVAPQGNDIIVFNNNNQLSSENTLSSTSRYRVFFGGGATSGRTIGGSTENTFFDYGGNAPKIENNSTGTHIINFPIKLGTGMEVNPVSGNLTLGGSINLQSHFLSVHGNNEKVLRINGAVSGTGGINIEGNSILEVAGDNSFSGNTTINAGKIKMISGGDLGTSLIQIGANGQFDLNGVNTTVSGVKEVGTSNGGTVSLGSGTLTINGANKGTLFQNSISGAGGVTMAGSGDTSLSLYGTQSYTGATTVSGGKISSGTALASTSYSVSGGTMETSADGVIANNATISLTGGNFSLGGNDTVGALTATGGRLTVGSGKTAYLSATSSVGAGAEIVGGNLQVNSGTTLTMNSDAAANTSAITIASGGTLKGSGTTTGALSVTGNLSPGNSTGILDVGNTTFLSGGSYTWEIDTFGAGAEVGTNWDFLDITGSLTFSATSENPFIINVVSLLASTDTAGEASGFVFTDNYSFAIATASSGFSNAFDAAAFSINTADFDNSMTASGYNSGAWSLSTSGNSLMLNYTGATLNNVNGASAIPEPSVASMFVLGLSALLANRRRRA